jgi:hypothetical protein
MLGFVRQGSKWGWKMGLFAGIFRYFVIGIVQEVYSKVYFSCFSGTILLMSVYRDKDDFVNYTTAGGNCLSHTNIAVTRKNFSHVNDCTGELQ